MDYVLILLLILAFISGFAVAVGLNYVIKWSVARELASQKGKMANLASQEKKNIVQGGNLAIVEGIASALKEEGDFKTKLPKIGAVLAENPEAAEALLKKAMTYSRYLR